MPDEPTNTVATKRVTILVTSTQRRGAEVFGEHLSRELPKRGWEVDFVALGRHASTGSRVSADPLSPFPVGRLEPAVIRRLRQRLKSTQPDLVLANGSSTLHYGVAAVHTLLRRPKLVYGSIGDPSFWANTPRRRVTYAAFLKLVDQVFSVSTPTARQLTELFGVGNARIQILPTGVPDGLFSVTRESHDGPMRVLFLGSLSDEKNPLAALETIGQLGTKPGAVLRFVGSGPLTSVIEEAAAGRGIPVELVGSVEDVRPHLAWADVLLLTSRTEGLPAAPLEAGAAGLPTVAFEVGGVAETIQHGVTGSLVPAGNVAAAADALRALAESPVARLQAGAAARAMVEARFTIEAAVDRYDRALTGLINKDEDH